MLNHHSAWLYALNRAEGRAVRGLLIEREGRAVRRLLIELRAGQ